MKSTPDTSSVSSIAVSTAWSLLKPVISEAGIDGQLLQLGPKAEQPFESVDRDRALYVAAGAVTVQMGATHYIIKTDSVLPIPPDRAIVVRNHGEEPAKVLSLLLPAPRVEWRLFVPAGFEAKT
jgi:quercetin dioxygenase-like cupin family protein